MTAKVKIFHLPLFSHVLSPAPLFSRTSISLVQMMMKYKVVKCCC